MAYSIINTARANGINAGDYTTDIFRTDKTRLPDSFWKLSKIHDDVNIVSLKMLFATYKKEYNKAAHPRFVPSFVK